MSVSTRKLTASVPRDHCHDHDTPLPTIDPTPRPHLPMRPRSGEFPSPGGSTRRTITETDSPSGSPKLLLQLDRLSMNYATNFQHGFLLFDQTRPYSVNASAFSIRTGRICPTSVRGPSKTTIWSLTLRPTSCTTSSSPDHGTGARCPFLRGLAGTFHQHLDVLSHQRHGCPPG